jgi:hypothetical protein
MATHLSRRIKLTFLWLRLCAIWAWRALLKYAVWALLPIAIFSAIPYLSHWTELSIRVAGFCLQVCGLLGIVAGVVRTRRQFGLPSVPEYVAQQIREFPRFPVDNVGTVALVSSLGRMSSTATASLVTAPSRDVNARLDALERDHQELKAKVANQHNETLDQLGKHAAELAKEKTDRSEEDRQSRVALYQTATGGLDLAVYGVIALAVANFYCTFPQEIACHQAASNCASTSHSSN